MQIVEAIRIVRGMAKQKRAFAATTRAHPYFKYDGYMQHVAKQAEREARAMENVCAALLTERNRNAATKPVDFLADSGRDERNGTR